jgi:hypothetical protein
LGASNGFPGKEMLVHQREQACYKAGNFSDAQENSLKARTSEIQSFGFFFLTSYMLFGQVNCVLRSPKGIKLYRLSGLTLPGFVPAGAFVHFSRPLRKALRCFLGTAGDLSLL